MWSWLEENHGAVGAIASWLTLVVWLAYLQLLYLSFRSAQRASILISIAGPPELASECILANMSLQPIYIEAVSILVEGRDCASPLMLSDLRGDGGDLRSSAMQGSLASGEMVSLGQFARILERANGPGSGGEGRFKLTAIAVYAGDDRLVAAEREFVHRDDQLYATSVGARQLRSWLDRRRLRRLQRSSRVISGGDWRR